MNWIRLLKNIPLRFNEERSDQLAYKLETYPDGYRRIFISPEIGFLCPKHWLVIAVWKFHAFGRNGRSEMLRFLKLAEGCGKLLDVGASAGIFSALFKVSRDRSEIVGIEPDRLSFDLFAETMEDNKRPGSSWRRERVLIGDKADTMRFSRLVLAAGWPGPAKRASLFPRKPWPACAND